MFGDTVYTISLITAAVALLALIAGSFSIGKSSKLLKEYFGTELIGKTVKLRSSHSAIAILAAEFFILCGVVAYIFICINPVAIPSSKSFNIIFCVDISKSMDCPDAAPSRLDNAKRFITKIINKSHDAEYAVIGFAGEAVTLMPLTSDKNYALSLAQSITTEYSTNTGTDIIPALEKAKVICGMNKKNVSKVILISDGENFSETKMNVKFDNKVQFYSVCLGTQAGGKIPTANGNYKDYVGNEVITKADKSYMKQLSEKFNGIDVESSNIDESVQRIFAQNNSKNYGDGLLVFVLVTVGVVLITLEIFRHK